MPAPKKYPNELRERAQRMVAQSMSEDSALTLNGQLSGSSRGSVSCQIRCAAG